MMLTPMPERPAEPSSRTTMMALRVGTSWVVAPTPAWAAAMRKVFRLMSDGIPVETALSRGATLSTAWFKVECPSLTELVGSGGLRTALLYHDVSLVGKGEKWGTTFEEGKQPQMAKTRGLKLWLLEPRLP